MIHHFSNRQLLKSDLKTVWDFFSQTENILKLTPAEMHFKVVDSKLDKIVHEGQIINYKVSPLFGIPLHWQTEITEVQEQQYFVDVQNKGPFALWKHQHVFTPTATGVLMEDNVSYKMPLGSIGNLVNQLVVSHKIEALFAYRTEVLDHLFNS